jgi:hypothetical protein
MAARCCVQPRVTGLDIQSALDRRHLRRERRLPHRKPQEQMVPGRIAHDRCL